MNDLNPRPHRPDFAHPSTPARTSLAFVAFLISGALLGGLLGLFEMQSSAAATALTAKPAVRCVGQPLRSRRVARVRLGSSDKALR
jgi:hypothetical protein